VGKRAVLLLLRFRYHIITRRGQEEVPLLAEACDVVAFRGRAQSPQWLARDEAETLLQAQPAANIAPEQAAAQIQRVLEGLDEMQPALNEMTETRGQELLDSHRRVRAAARQKGVRYTVRPQLPPDILGVYVLLPVVR
jgi:hypothetical protein